MALSNILNLANERRRNEEFAIALAAILALEFETDPPSAHEVDCFLDDIDELIAAARDDGGTHYQIGVASFGEHGAALTNSLAFLEKIEREFAITLPRKALR
jgi:hypothetical protein